MNVFSKAEDIIEIIKAEKLTLLQFLDKYCTVFKDIPRGSLIAPEYRYRDSYSEKAFVFLIGSYVYYSLYQKPVTWLERYRFAEFSDYSVFFKKTICTDTSRRIGRLDELQKIITEISVEKNTSLLSLKGEME
ncbi:MAG: hypothetical protein IKO47_00175 [Ruminococcus sp.]|nr:hypothetical protein [Ruminococcus sp.]